MEMDNNTTFFSPNFGDSGMKQPINTTLIYVFAVLGIVFALCCGMGIIFAIISVILSVSKMNAYKVNPTAYIGVEGLKTAQLVSYISLGINVLVFIWVLFSLLTTDWNVFMQQYQEILRNVD